MLARRSKLILAGETVGRTPLLIPSFSSKGFSELKKIVAFAKEFITDVTLVSAYDLRHNLLDSDVDFAELVFLDSGGYEAAEDYDYAEVYKKKHVATSWDYADYEEVVRGWNPAVPSAVVTFDAPDRYLSIGEQIERALETKKLRGDVLWEFLLKPETKTQRFLPVKKILEDIHRLAGFDVIGVAEKELGSSYRKRMTAIAELRLALDAAGIEAPIHVFGCLDPVTTPLYFLAGAEIFDGLTWLRLAFLNGRTMHISSAAAEVEHGTQRSETDLFQYVWSSNIYYINTLRLQMSSYIDTEKLGDLVKNTDLYEAELQTLHGYLEKRT